MAFAETSRTERIELCAKSTGRFGQSIIKDSFGKLWNRVNPDLTVNYDPYTDAAQSQDLQEAHKICVFYSAAGIRTQTFANEKWYDCMSYDNLKEAIADCAAMIQYEKEQP